MFIQIHILQSMPPGNVNRDDSGQPKKCIFGGVTRGRISSQCLKRNIRTSPQFEEVFGGQLAKRTKYLPRLVADAIKAAGTIPIEELDGIKAGIAAEFKKEVRAEQEDHENPTASAVEATDVTPQLVFFQPAFATKIAALIDTLRQEHPNVYRQLISVKKKKGSKEKDEDKAADAALTAFRESALRAKESLSIDVGLFGRMTTSDIVVDVEAACQVAHAISTHETLIESDYFTALDDLQNQFVESQTKRGGAGFVSSAENRTFFSSAVYYKYLNLDRDALLKNVSGIDPSAVDRAAGVLVEAAALATPTGKQNSFAAHSTPDLILVEISRRKQPLSYANAFLRAVSGEDLMKASVEALADHCTSVAAAYAPPDTKRFLLAVGAAEEVPLGLQVERIGTLAGLSEAITKYVSSGRAGAH
jgi:CRISPR system Cascade subunit CasC